MAVPHLLPRPRVATAAAVVFVAALVLRVGLVLLVPRFAALPPGEMEHVAASWAATGQLANPYATPTGPTAHLPPVYPLLLGGIYRIFGAGEQGRFAQAMFGCVLSALRCALIVPLAIGLGLGIRVAWVAGALSVFYISAFNTEVRGAWEAPLTALAMMALVCMAIRFARAPVFNAWTAAGYGLFSGLSLLLAPALLATLAAFACCTAAVRPRDARRYAAWLLGMGLVVALVLTPWTLRNARALGAPIVFRSNFGLELSLAYNASGRASALDDDIIRSHPLLNAEVSREIARIGEVAFHRERQREASAWIRAHPARSAKLFAAHVFYFWFPPAANVAFRVALALVTVCAALGFIALRKLSRLAMLLIGLIWATYPLIYYVTYWSSRYRYPMEWTLVLCVAVCLCTGSARRARGAAQSPR